MKKILIGLFSVFCLFFLIGCGGEKEPTMTHEEEITKYFNELLPDVLTDSVEFCDDYVFLDGTYAVMFWESSDTSLVTKNGIVKQRLFDEEVTIKLNVLFDNDEDEINLNKKLTVKGLTTLDEYKLEIEKNIPDYIYKDQEINTRDKTFSRYNIFGDIKYTIAEPTILGIKEVSDGINGRKTTYLEYINQEKEDQTVHCNYTVDVDGYKVEGSKAITVEGRNNEKYIGEAKQYLEGLYKSDLIYNQIELPTVDENERVTISWKSDNNYLIDDNGVLCEFKPNKKVTMTATINYNGVIETWEKTFRTYNDDEFLDFIVNRIHRDEIQQFNMHVITYNTDNLGFVPFYYRDIDMKKVVTETTAFNETLTYVSNMERNPNASDLKMQTGLVSWTGTGRPTTHKAATKTIVVHDTGTTSMSAEDWNETEVNGDPRETSWNFTVGEDVIYQHIPIHEISWHAGCGGTTLFELNDTGVKFTKHNPEITLGKDGYIHINDEKSNIAIPKRDGRLADGITASGLYTCRGENGNYFMADVYTNKWGSRYLVSTLGGNANGVGIETDIHLGVDYNKVMRNCANLVANLLVYFDLEPDRVLQHRHFSGKHCPQVMIENDLWPNFKRMVETEYLIKKYIPDVKLEYTVENEKLMDNTGKILEKVTDETVVKYSVKATLNGETSNYNFKTVIKPMAK